MDDGVVDLERKRDEISADPEIHRLAQAQDAGEPPNQIDAEGENGVTEKLAEQEQYVAVGARKIRKAPDDRHHQGAQKQRPHRQQGRSLDDFRFATVFT